MEEIIQTKIDILLTKKQRIEDNYSFSDKETKQKYDKILQLIEMEIKLIETYNPKIKIR